VVQGSSITLVTVKDPGSWNKDHTKG
jgi:hypothetical protein